MTDSWYYNLFTAAYTGDTWNFADSLLTVRSRQQLGWFYENAHNFLKSLWLVTVSWEVHLCVCVCAPAITLIAET